MAFRNRSVSVLALAVSVLAAGVTPGHAGIRMVDDSIPINAENCEMYIASGLVAGPKKNSRDRLELRHEKKNGLRILTVVRMAANGQTQEYVLSTGDAGLQDALAKRNRKLQAEVNAYLLPLMPNFVAGHRAYAEQELATSKASVWLLGRKGAPYVRRPEVIEHIVKSACAQEIKVAKAKASLVRIAQAIRKVFDPFGIVDYTIRKRASVFSQAN